MKMTSSARRVGVAEAKAKFSEVLATAERSPVIVHKRGHDLAVVLGMAAYEKLAGSPTSGTVRAWLDDVARLKRDLGGVDDFEPERADFGPPQAAFARRR